MEKISKTQVEKKLSRKRNPRLRALIIELKKQDKLKLASLLALPKRKAIAVTLEKIDGETKADDVVIVPGKILGKGNINHKITLAALSFSTKARKKLKNCKIIDIEQVVKNKDFKLIC